MRLEPSNGVVSGVTTSFLVCNRNCIVQGLILAPAAASCTVALYDPAPIANLTQGIATTVGATLRLVLSGAAAGGSTSASISASGVEFANGCIAVVAGAGAQASIVFATI